MAFEEYQCYEVYLATRNREPDLHVRVVDELDNDYIVECLWRNPNCYEKIGRRTGGTSSDYGICKESVLNTEEHIEKLNKNYYKDALYRYELYDTIIDEGIRWYVLKELFSYYYLPCKTHRTNMYLKLERMLKNNL